MVDANAIPEKQWGAMVQKGGGFKIEEIPVPQPGPGQVLVKIECAPLNPSDIYFLQGMYEKLNEPGDEKLKLPMVCGWEGAGTVVASGGGLMAWRILGKRVAVSKMEEPHGVISVGGAY